MSAEVDYVLSTEPSGYSGTYRNVMVEPYVRDELEQ